MSSDAIAACPGYAATPLVFDMGIGESIRPCETCAHIQPLRTGRGYMAGCTHPNAWHVIRMAEGAVAQRGSPARGARAGGARRGCRG